MQIELIQNRIIFASSFFHHNSIDDPHIHLRFWLGLLSIFLEVLEYFAGVAGSLGSLCYGGCGCGEGGDRGDSGGDGGGGGLVVALTGDS